MPDEDYYANVCAISETTDGKILIESSSTVIVLDTLLDYLMVEEDYKDGYLKEAGKIIKDL